MSTYASNNILGQYEQSISSAASSNRVATDKDTFLKLLVAQLTHQDPLNPVEDKEFIAQLAQFTQVEELQNLRTSVDGIVEGLNTQQVTNAASLLGTLVLAKGDNVYLQAGEAEQIDPTDLQRTGWKYIYFTPPRDVESGYIRVSALDANGNATNVVYTEEIPGGEYKAEKDYAFFWHGRNSAGQAMPAGSYMVSVVAYDEDGKQMVVDTASDGLVIGVETAADGNHKLELQDTRTVNYMDIQKIRMYIGSSGDSGDSGDDGKDETGSGGTNTDGTNTDGTDGTNTGGTNTDDTGGTNTDDTSGTNNGETATTPDEVLDDAA